MKYILDCADAHFIANIIGLCTGKCVVDPTPIVKFFFCLSIIWKFTTSSILPAFHSCWLWGSHWPWQWPGNLVQWGIIKFRSKLQLQHRVCYQRHQYTYLSDKWSMVWKWTHMWKWEHFYYLYCCTLYAFTEMSIHVSVCFHIHKSDAFHCRQLFLSFTTLI